ncbi:MAG: hypothetical protein ACJ8F7_08725, partial [Gemmataceae bacterium]
MKTPTVRTLTIRQPDAYAVLAGIKSVVNRRRPTEYAGPLLIHAANTASDSAIKRFPCGTPVPDIDFPRGCIVGAATVIACFDYESCLRDDPPGRYPPKCRAYLKDEPHAEGPYCLFLDRPLAFAEPIPCAGGTG